MVRIYRKLYHDMDEVLFQCYKELGYLFYTPKGSMKKGWDKRQRRRHLRTRHLIMSMMRDRCEGRYLTPMEAKTYDAEYIELNNLRCENKHLKETIIDLRKICDAKDKVEAGE